MRTILIALTTLLLLGAAQQPPADQAPTEPPAAGQPSEGQAPAAQPPADRPDADRDPADQPAADQAPAGQTPTDQAGGEQVRIIRISSEGATASGDFRYGPIAYAHSDPEGILATVSNLTILAQYAELRVPAGQQGEVLLSQAVGEREASFEGGIRVERGRLGATGPALVYSEATGLGVLRGGATIHIAPADAEDDPVDITAEEVEFDVDTDRSTSRGDVRLVSGNQAAVADVLVYVEDRNLGELRSEGGQVTITRTADDGGELLITADTISVLTDEGRLYARGNVTVVDGSITSTGNEVFFDDDASRAEVIGSPARSVDEEQGIELTGGRLEHRTDLSVVSIIDESVPSEFDVSAFTLSSAESD